MIHNLRKVVFICMIICMLIKMSIANNRDDIQSSMYNLFSILMYLAYTISLFLSIPTLLKKPWPALAKVHTFIIILLSIFFLVLYGFNANIDVSEIYMLSIPLGMVLISYSMDLSKKELISLLLFFCLGVLVMGLYKTFFNIGGFIILEQYQFGSKNQITPIVASSILILLFLVLNNFFKRKYILNVLIISVIIVLFVIIIVARGRTTLFSIIITSFFIIFFYSRKEFNKLIFIIFILLALFVMGGYELIQNSIFTNYKADDLNSVSSGRLDGYIAGFNFWMENIYWGEIFSSNPQEYTPHNFILYRLTKFGIIGGFLSIALYFIYIYFILKRIVLYKKRDRKLSDLGFLLLLIPFIISLGEYTFPFGPGTSQVINFFMLGYLLRQENIISNE